MTTSTALAQLASTLKAPIEELDGLAMLNSSQLQQLDAYLQAAQQTQRAELEAAIERGLSHIPALLRGPVKKIIRG